MEYKFLTTTVLPFIIMKYIHLWRYLNNVFQLQGMDSMSSITRSTTRKSK